MEKNNNDKYSKIIKELGTSRVKLSEPLSRHTTFGIGGPADLFYEAKTTKELIEAIKIARKTKTPYFILGGGSNILVADSGFRGLVIKIATTKVKTIARKMGAWVIQVDAGCNLRKLINWTVVRGLSGLEFAVGIPGTLGGAVRGNAGAWTQAIGELVSRVEILDKNLNKKWLEPRVCRFGYRTSRFKKNGEVILSAELVLNKNDQKTIRGKINENFCKRSSQPSEPSAGCIFINPKPQAAGQLIDLCLMKGVRSGGAQVSPKHANFIVNLGRAKASDVLKLINLAKKEVKKKFGVELKEEISLVGFDRMSK